MGTKLNLIKKLGTKLVIIPIFYYKFIRVKLEYIHLGLEEEKKGVQEEAACSVYLSLERC